MAKVSSVAYSFVSGYHLGTPALSRYGAIRGISSVGRAIGLQPIGHRFKSDILHCELASIITTGGI